MSHRAVTWAYDQDIHPSAAKFVLVTLANYADEDGYCYPSQRRIADDTGQSERSVRTHLATLESLGVIRREHRFDKAGHRSSDGFHLIGLPATFSGRPPAKPAARKGSLPEESAAGLPATFASPTGNFRQSPPANISALIRNEPSYEPSEGLTEAVPPRSSVREMPYAAFAAMCEGLGSDPKRAVGKFKDQQISIAGDLLNDGYTCDQIRRVSSYIRSQSWRSSPSDMRTVSAVIGSWVLADEPEREVASGNSRAESEYESDELSYEELDARINGRLNA